MDYQTSKSLMQQKQVHSRKFTNPFFRDVDFTDPQNWPVVLRELEIMGWGKFSTFRNETKVEFCLLPILYLQGYFEGMFGVQTRDWIDTLNK